MTTNLLSVDLPKIVQDNYARFGQGDIPGILATLAEDVVWTHPGNASLPFAGTFRGPAAVANGFFTVIGRNLDVTVFQPTNFRQSGNQVVNDIHIEARVLPTGKTFSIDGAIQWTFDEQGRVQQWEHLGDVSAMERAFE